MDRLARVVIICEKTAGQDLINEDEKEERVKQVYVGSEGVEE